ncbi:globin domain-containing protein [Kineococcus sp. SYSU DK003]|uniref:globin domain-containing protein n=1 Tax=Kineococcus sp. SYSU DK003 TaxID=3383124 RepID=UPI003D7D511A
MLSEKSRPVVEATLPVVAENIGQIARCFYRRLFDAHPELLDGTFNRGNQAQGSQQLALAGSVALFASALLRDPEQLPERLLTRIAHKHASLGVRPRQYDVVHEHLFAAIAEVLGEAVTAEVAAAWDEVYWLMAYALVNIERGLYSARATSPDTVWRTWRVAQRRDETGDVVTFVVERTDDRLVRSSLPGQYVTVQVPMPDGVLQPRQYSLTRADDGRHRQFSVKRVRAVGGKPAGEVSNVLCDTVQVGHELTLSVPFGDVVLDDSRRPVVFVSAGIGITPFAGMLSHLAAAASELPVLLLHADVAVETFALREQVLGDVSALPGARAHVWLERDGGDRSVLLPVDGVHEGFVDLDAVDLPAGAAYYLCGPLPFMKAVRSRLVGDGVPARDVHHEVFGPDLWTADLAGVPSPGAA